MIVSIYVQIVQRQNRFRFYRLRFHFWKSCSQLNIFCYCLWPICSKVNNQIFWKLDTPSGSTVVLNGRVPSTLHSQFVIFYFSRLTLYTHKKWLNTKDEVQMPCAWNELFEDNFWQNAVLSKYRLFFNQCRSKNLEGFVLICLKIEK